MSEPEHRPQRAGTTVVKLLDYLTRLAGSALTVTQLYEDGFAYPTTNSRRRADLTYSSATHALKTKRSDHAYWQRNRLIFQATGDHL